MGSLVLDEKCITCKPAPQHATITTVPAMLPKIVGNPNCDKCHGMGYLEKKGGWNFCKKCKSAALETAACKKCGDTGLLFEGG